MHAAIAISDAVAQVEPGVAPAVEPGLGSLFGSAVSAALTTLVIGAILVAIVPGYVERVMGELEANPVGSFGYGIVTFAFFALVGLVLAIADRLVGREEGWTK